MKNGYTPSDVAHTGKQAKKTAMGSYEGYSTKILKSPKGEVYKYTIYTKPKKMLF